MASTGTTIQTEIDRLKKAKSDIKTAIINKGGTISDTATIDTYASAIDGIPTGGSDTTKYLVIDENEFLNTDYDNKKEIELSPEQKELLSKNLNKIVIDVYNKDNGAHYYIPLFLFVPNVGAAWSLDMRDNEGSITRFGANYYRVEYFDGHMNVWRQKAEFAIVSKVEQDSIGYDFVPKMSAVYDAINK